MTLIVGCSKQADVTQPVENKEAAYEPAPPNEPVEIITLTKEGRLSQGDCMKRKLNDKVIMLESMFCGHCKATMPDFISACEGKGIEPIVLDIADNEVRSEMKSYGVQAQLTPTFIFGCHIVLGAQSKETYLRLCDEFLAKQ
ncbi:hypothetical protein COT48_03245 [Candidatus Woesearchaeota archaeon CG08_land_8_20_14_0_20_47_9]|nr:MAG: hypothetical protein AUJ69_01375 [Candidatus Woesearchaeota archaeon CG1_02_47_18]PIO03886.1 MAG: hypothetical protein COT48_03245 [Candidatus Woesearchaeota archaeon CG08_land_8_20_14_0_20_47_9]